MEMSSSDPNLTRSDTCHQIYIVSSFPPSACVYRVSDIPQIIISRRIGGFNVNQGTCVFRIVLWRRSFRGELEIVPLIKFMKNKSLRGSFKDFS